MHNHGNSGADFSDGNYEGLMKMAQYLAQNGVTSFAPASMTLPYNVLETAYQTAVRFKNEQPEDCARLMGIQMEGPFFSEKKKARRTARICEILILKHFSGYMTSRRGFFALWMWRRSCLARQHLPGGQASFAQSLLPIRTAPTTTPAMSLMQVQAT